MKTLIIGLLAIAILVIPQTVSAQPVPSDAFDVDLIKVGPVNTGPLFVGYKPPVEPQPVIQPNVPETRPKQPKPVVYVVVSGDNLSTIGTAHKTEWQRIWAKNKSIKHPDVIHVGDKLTIPAKDEVLKKRKLPAAVSLPVATPRVSKPDTSKPAANYDATNTYDYGYCTWYVKNRRGASLPNGLGNANTWFSRAQSMGLSTGYTPRVGAVGTTTSGSLGHVVYVEAVHGDGTITISEMNYEGFAIQSSRVTSASEFSYIY